MDAANQPHHVKVLELSNMGFSPLTELLLQPGWIFWKMRREEKKELAIQCQTCRYLNNQETAEEDF